MIMDKYLDEKTVGQFVINGKTYFGVMELEDSKSILTVYLNEFFDQDTQMNYLTWIQGTLYDLTKVTLIDMLYIGSGGNNKQNPDGSYEHSRYLKFDLHYVVFGDSFVDKDQEIFTSIDFSIPDSNTLFRFESFKHIFTMPKDKVKEIINNDNKSQLNDGFGEVNNRYKFGDNPQIHIYTGAYILEEFLIPYGRFKVRNNMNSTLSWNKGFNVENIISCFIEFNQLTSFWEALKMVDPIIKLSELILGKKQTSNNYKLEVETKSSIPTTYQVYQTKLKKELQTDSVHPSDRLIHIEVETEEFENMLNKWLLRHEEWRFARNEFFSAFSRKVYSSDTLIKAANLFDIIPNSAFQKLEPVSDEVLEAKEACKNIFKELPVSLERDSILGALGRIGKKSLKHKIRDRYFIIENSNLVELEDIEIVIGQAVDCRNFFVHGGTPKFDYIINFNEICFFIDTLLFIYGASEMVELGWSFTKWNSDSFNDHPFSLYLMNYSHNLTSLKQVSDIDTTIVEFQGFKT